MKQKILLLSLAFLVAGAAAGFAQANQPQQPQHQPANQQTNQPAATPQANQSANQQAAVQKAKQHHASRAEAAMWDSFKPQTISGQITMITPDQKEIVVTNGNVNYAFKLTNKTKINVNGSQSSATELSNQVHKKASVKFVAKPDGNFAQSVTVNG